MREKIVELRKTMTLKQVAELLNIPITKVTYYAEPLERYRERKRLARKTFMLKLKQEHGGKCSKCGYNKNFAALCFHHTNDNKEHEISDLVKSSRLKLAKVEAKKCVLLCSNCHIELHNPV